MQTWQGAALVRPPRPSLGSMAAGAALLCIAAAPIYAGFTLSPLHASPSLGPLTVALLLSFVPMIARALAVGRRALARTALFTAGAAAAYFAGHALADGVAPSLSPSPELGATSALAWSIVVAGLVVLFLAQTVVQTSPGGRLARLIQPHLLRGLYIDDWFTRMTFRMWPPRLERSSAASPSSRTRPRLYSRSHG